MLNSEPTNPRQYDFNSMILSGRQPVLNKRMPPADEYSSRINEIRALKKFDDLFKKDASRSDPVSQSTCLAVDGRASMRVPPHGVNNRLRGMFVLRKRAEMEYIYSDYSSSEEEMQGSQQSGLTGRKFNPCQDKYKKRQISISNHDTTKKTQSKAHNFIYTHTSTSLHSTTHRPHSQLDAPGHKVFNARTLHSLVLQANRAITLKVKATNFLYFSVYVEEGNNSELIKAAVRKRPGWKVVELPEVANMVWSQFYRKSLDLQAKPKAKTSRQENTDETAQQQLFPLIREALLKRKSALEAKQSQTGPNLLPLEAYNRQVAKLCPRLQHLNRNPSTQIASPSRLHFYNHIPNNHLISDKKHLLANMRKLYQSRGLDVFDVMPLSLEVGEGCELGQVEGSVKAEDREAYWLVKPGENSNRGRGIVVCRGLGAAIEEVNTRCSNQKQPMGQEQALPDTKETIEELKLRKKCSSKPSFILQKYIQPMLYFKRKFDIRMYMLVTHVGPKLRGYIYNEGYIRTSSKFFTMDTFNKFVHLTNDAIQSRSADYGKYEEGNKVSWKKFKKWLEDEGFGEFWPVFVSDYRRICKNVLESVRDAFMMRHRKHSSGILWGFSSKKPRHSPQETTLNSQKPQQPTLPQTNSIYYQIFGLDFLLDPTPKTWLIEVNTNPAITTDCSRVVNSLVPNMIDNALSIAVQPYLRGLSARTMEMSRFDNNFQAIYDDQWVG